MYCSNCGKGVLRIELTCDACGTKAAEGAGFCGKCGHTLGTGPLTCEHCGFRLVRDASPGRDWLTTLLLCLFLGGFGIHRFYTGHIAIGFIQAITLGGFGIWWIADIITIVTGSYRDKAGSPLSGRGYTP